MLYFKNTELAKEYHVTLRTVLNWIEATKQGKLDLVLHTESGKSYVANTARNITLIKQMVEDRKKYRNTKAVKTVEPKPEFYRLFNQGQIYDLVTSLEIHREIPRQYNYFDGGASHWDQYATTLAHEETPNLIKSTIDLVDKHFGYIDDLLKKYKRVNVVDIGVGNALPVKGLLQHLLDQQKLGRYIALDISSDILKIAQKNIHAWFGNKVVFEDYEVDINYDRFSNILAEEYLRDDSQDTANLVLLLGGTLCNFRVPDGAFKIIHDSMSVNDFLMHTQKLDSEATRRYFDFNIEPGKSELAPIHENVVSLLNIDKSFYDVEMGFDQGQQQRYVRMTFKIALSIKFKFETGERTLEINKGEKVLVWRSWQQTALDVVHQLDHNDFYTLHSSQTEDQEYILTVSRVKRELGDHY